MRAAANDHRMKRFFGKNDILLAAALLIVSAAALFFLRAGDAGKTAEISVDGKPWASYALSEDRVVEVESEHGRNLIEISGGSVRMLEADCPNGDCLAHAPVSREGQIIVCLPHRLVVKITGGEAYDSVAY